jgi:hypothetical protein
VTETFRLVFDGEFFEDVAGGKPDGDVVTVATDVDTDAQLKGEILSHVASFADKVRYHPRVSSTYRATCGTIPVDPVGMMQMTGAAFQS